VAIQCCGLLHRTARPSSPFLILWGKKSFRCGAESLPLASKPNSPSNVQGQASVLASDFDSNIFRNPIVPARVKWLGAHREA
jgi:hypothetical protein